MQNQTDTALSDAELRDLRCVAGMMVPASNEFDVPGADDPTIFADIVKSLGRDPERSVVNDWGRSHDVKNLFIVDGSVFVTGGGVNPTSTIQAVALYIADQIKQRLATLFD